MGLVNTFDDYLQEPKFEIDEFAIGGKLLSITVSMGEDQYLQSQNDHYWKQEMRNKLVERIVDRILQENLIEITTNLDPVTFTRQINARLYLAPDSQVKIIRSLKNVPLAPRN